MNEKRMGAEEELYLAPENENPAEVHISAKKEEKVSIPTEKKDSQRKEPECEIEALRTENRKVFRMKDGSERAVIYPATIHMHNDETGTFEEADPTLIRDDDPHYYRNKKGRFTARFNCDEANDELFVIEQGMHRVRVEAKKTKKDRMGGGAPALREKILVFEGAEAGADFEYSVTNSGVKENIIIKEKAPIYRYSFLLHCENVCPDYDEKSKRLAFLSNETGKEIFFIPAPFMKDSDGAVSTNVSYEVKNASDGVVQMTILADSGWINAPERAFPVAIDPQIMMSGSGAMTTYHWEDGVIQSASMNQHRIGSWNTTVSDKYVSSGLGEADPVMTTNLSSIFTAQEIADAPVLPIGQYTQSYISCPGEKKIFKIIANTGGDQLDSSGYSFYTFNGTGMVPYLGAYLYAGDSFVCGGSSDPGNSFLLSEKLAYGETYYLVVCANYDNTGYFELIPRIMLACHTYRMYMNLALPTLPRNPRIKKVELTFHQTNVNTSGGSGKLGLYHVPDKLATSYSPRHDGELIDFCNIKTDMSEAVNPIPYNFDITKLYDRLANNELEYSNLLLKLIEEDCNNGVYVDIGGSVGSEFAPELSITYETNYGINTSSRTHTHELGRFGQGSIDLQCGNLMFEAEDFAWAGNRMPVAVKHLYNSALSDYSYTNNDSIDLHTANFDAMKLGNGFKLNLMQSMKEKRFMAEGVSHDGYVWIGENGEETYFKPTDNANIFKCIDDDEMVFDKSTLTLTMGDEIYTFDSMGRLVKITDANKNTQQLTYTENRLTSVTDGAGREFAFGYDGSGHLTAITAPDTSAIEYTYNGDLLEVIKYPDGSKATLSYSAGRPSEVTLKDALGNAVYKVAYTFANNRVASVTEYGVENGTFVLGASTAYDYSAAARRTIVQTTELADTAEGETEDRMIKTVYTFDHDGEIISDYVYAEDLGNMGIDGEASGIHPYAGEGGAGAIRNATNLLLNHTFASMDSWQEIIGNPYDFECHTGEFEGYTKFGKNYLCMNYFADDCIENGVYQETPTLPAGEYTFSAYIFEEDSMDRLYDANAFIRVIGEYGRILAVSEPSGKLNAEPHRLIAPFTLKTAQKVKLQILMTGSGHVYVSNAQLENNPYANAYNHLENGNFEHDTHGWNCSAGVSLSANTRFNMSHALRMEGDLEAERTASQSVAVKSAAGTRETFTLSGWAKGFGVPDHQRECAEDAIFRLRAKVVYADESENEEPITADFSPCTEEWQFVSVDFAKEEYKAVDHVEIYCEYSYNHGTAYFDDLQLTRESIETGLTAEDFVREVAPESDESAEGNASSETAEETAPAFEELIDAFGNTLTETTFTDGEFGTIYRAFGFDEDGNDLLRETDARGNITEYTVNEETSRNEEITDRCGNKTAYEYDVAGKVTKVISKDANGVELANVSYAYDAFDQMTEIQRGDGMKYILQYNAYHNLESIGICGECAPLVSYAYKNGNGRLKAVTYANGDTMKATYNSLGQMVAEKWYNGSNVLIAHYKYVYDSEGNIVRSIDMTAKKEYNYYYESGKLIRASECNITLEGEIVTAKVLVNSILYSYDDEDRMTKKRIVPANGAEQVIFYENTEDDQTIVKFIAGGQTVTSHSKSDSFGRKEFDELQIGTGFVSRQFAYHMGEVTDEHKDSTKVKSTPTTQLVSRIAFSDGRTISYEYDAEERIRKVVDSEEGTTRYTYDALGQLLTETKDGVLVNSMTYDHYGNILSKNGEQYCYDEGWKDRLTCFGSRCIEYDAQGNPTQYMGHTLSWEKGRQLKSYDNIRFTYNANGIRTSKTVNGIKHTYTLDGTKILREAWGTNVLIPLYDNEDSVCGIIYNDTPYYFQKNLQGDVIAITNCNAEIVAKYSYDAWGKCSITCDSSCDCDCIAEVNPFRYRGYYFDRETGMYYLQSRYYDVFTSKFINADDMGLHFATAASGCYTPWHYCYNDPVNFIDECGYASSSVKEKIKSYAKETWIAWILNKFIKKVTNNGRLNLIKFNKLGLEMQLFLEMSSKKGNIKLSKSSIEARFKGISFKLGWGGKLEAALGVTIFKHTVSFLRGVDWKKSYFAISISYVTKDGRLEFTTGLYVSIAHLLKLAIAVTVVGVCVVLPTLAPAFMSAISALSAKSKVLVTIGSTILKGLMCIPAKA